jgi:hypothetical protein
LLGTGTGGAAHIQIQAHYIVPGKPRPANGKNGRPIKRARLSELIGAAAKAPGLPAECVTHGIGKVALRRLAEHGSTSK